MNNCFNKIELNKFIEKFSIKIIFQIFIFLLVASVVYNLSSYLTIYKIDFLNKIYTKIEIENKNLYFHECEPFLKNADNFYVKLNDQIYPKSLPLYMNRSINFDCLNKSKTIKKIFLWNSFFGDSSFSFGLGERKPFILNKCPVTSCEVLNNRTRLNESDYVLVHIRNGFDQIPRYPHRKLDQKWIFVLYESPAHSPDVSSLNGLFNLTSTYRFDSSFHSPYKSDFQFHWSNESNKTAFLGYNESFNYLKEKTKFATALISNCHTSSNRLNLIKSLQKYIEIDVYGRCGKPCPSVYFYNSSITGDCRNILSRDYKFFFSFENSLCKDYITEKFFLALIKYPIIPVVLGAGNYNYHIPKSGYIDVSDFDSPKKLADYLIELSNNSTKYNSFFNWRKYINDDGTTMGFMQSPICEMCIKLQLESYFQPEISNIEDLGNYWKGNEICSYKNFTILTNL